MLIVALIAVVAIGIIIFLFAVSQPTTEQRLEQRREQFLQAQTSTSPQMRSAISEELSTSFWQRVVKPALEAYSSKLAMAAPAGMIEAARKKLAAAGNPMGMTESVFLLFRGVAALSGAGSAYFIYTELSKSPPMMRLAITFFALFAISMLPDYIVSNALTARQAAIRRSLPDLLDLLVVCTEAGMGLDGALAEVVARKSGSLVDEFNRTLVEVRLGKRRSDAWQDMADRVNVPELSTLVAALYQAQTLGVSISRALRTHSDSLRSQRRIRLQEQGALLSTKMLFPLIFLIFPALFVVILGPGAIQIMHTLGAGFGAK